MPSISTILTIIFLIALIVFIVLWNETEGFNTNTPYCDTNVLAGTLTGGIFGKSPLC
jgi:hypothetical protein